MCGTHGLEDVCFSILTHTRPNSASPQTVRSNRLSCTVLWWAQLNKVDNLLGDDAEFFELPLATTITACTLIVPPAFCVANRFLVNRDGDVEICGEEDLNVNLATLFPNASKFFNAQFDGECGSRLLTYL